MRDEERNNASPRGTTLSFLPRQDWDEEIRQALNRADVILFLVSPAFVESCY